MPRWNVQLWWRNSDQHASGKPGAVHWRGCSRACRAGSSWYGRSSTAAVWPSHRAFPTTGDCRSKLSRNRRVSRNCGDRSGTSLVSAGSRTMMFFDSSRSRKLAVLCRTSSEIPVAGMTRPSEPLCSTRLTIHSAPRILTRAPGAMEGDGTICGCQNRSKCNLLKSLL